VHGLTPGLLCGSFGLLQQGAQVAGLGFDSLPALLRRLGARLRRRGLRLHRDELAALGLDQHVEPVGTRLGALQLLAQGR
jgi:hypothetical protein